MKVRPTLIERVRLPMLLNTRIRLVVRTQVKAPTATSCRVRLILRIRLIAAELLCEKTRPKLLWAEKIEVAVLAKLKGLPMIRARLMLTVEITLKFFATPRAMVMAALLVAVRMIPSVRLRLTVPMLARAKFLPNRRADVSALEATKVII
jgi:hypothetical protein